MKVNQPLANSAGVGHDDAKQRLRTAAVIFATGDLISALAVFAPDHKVRGGESRVQTLRINVPAPCELAARIAFTPPASASGSSGTSRLA